jgi:ubiquinone/menaquinone biosynthesis C-methylase UbiE
VHAQDHFSTVSNQYAASRPRYPRALYEWLARVAPGRERAWDCACGNGQASNDLADYFSQVVATDLSANQLREAKAHPRVEYRVAVAESSGLPSASLDVVTVAQALHWFQFEQFYAEVRRVLRPGGVFAAWCYGTGTITVESADRVFQDFYHGVVGPYWQPERKLVEDGYRTLPFPKRECAAPILTMELDWSLEALMGYVRSWSATARYIQARRSDPVPDLYDRLLPSWGDPRASHKIRWPLNVRAAILNAQ